MKTMEEHIKQLSGELLKTRSGITALKNLAAQHKLYEVASAIRDYEKENFKEHEDQVEEARSFQKMLKLLDLDVSEPIAWTLLQAGREYINKGGEATVADLANITLVSRKIFGK